MPIYKSIGSFRSVFPSQCLPCYVLLPLFCIFLPRYPRFLRLCGKYIRCRYKAYFYEYYFIGQFCNIPRHGNKKVILLQVVTGLLATSEANSLLNVIFDYFSHTALPIMAQFYGHYIIEVLTMFA